jgi:hypothetical protein
VSPWSFRQANQPALANVSSMGMTKQPRNATSSTLHLNGGWLPSFLASHDFSHELQLIYYSNMDDSPVRFL